MVPDFVIDAYKDNCFVVHPSLLPYHRGSSPISAALLAGDQRTGASIVETSKGKFDAGKIYL
jgi:methionyl-tRNA formyltransferase